MSWAPHGYDVQSYTQIYSEIAPIYILLARNNLLLSYICLSENRYCFIGFVYMITSHEEAAGTVQYRLGWAAKYRNPSKISFLRSPILEELRNGSKFTYWRMNVWCFGVNYRPGILFSVNWTDKLVGAYQDNIQSSFRRLMRFPQPLSLTDWSLSGIAAVDPSKRSLEDDWKIIILTTDTALCLRNTTVPRGEKDR